MADLPVPLYDMHVAVKHHNIYVSGTSPIEGAKYQVYVFNIDADQWGQLPQSGHWRGTLHIISDKLTIIGGHLSATKRRTNKVLSFNEDSEIWASYYPDLLSARSRPGVVSHLEHVIVAGGKLDDHGIHDDIEVLNWVENSHWRKVSIKLPVPMYNFFPTICDDHILIVGYSSKDEAVKKGAYKLPVANITASVDQQHNEVSSRWTELTAVTHSYVSCVPSLLQPVIVGGWKSNDKVSTADIKMYDSSDCLWKKIGSLSSGKSSVGVAAVHDNALIIIGGWTQGDKRANYKSSCLPSVELGQAELATSLT